MQYPYAPPYPYYPPPRRNDAGKILLIVVVVVVAVVLITIVLAAVLYVMVSGLLGGPGGPGPQTMGIAIRQAGANWSLEVAFAPAGRVPSNTFLTAFDNQGGLVLARTPWSDLTLANWPTNRVVYEDSNPSVPEIVAGDRLLADRGTYPAGTVVQISYDQGILWTGPLQ